MIIEKIKEWIYAIPVIARLRHIYYAIRDWNRAVGYLINWFVMHPAAAYAMTGIGMLIGVVVSLFTHNPLHIWLAGFLTSIVVWLAYLSLEIIGWKKAPWWDHVMDMVGPTWVVVHMCLRWPR